MRARGPAVALILLSILLSIWSPRPAAGDDFPWEPTEVVVPPDELDGTPDVVLMLGHDMVYAPATDDAPLLGNVELAVTTRTLKLGYATLKSSKVGHLGYVAAKALGAGGDENHTQACFLCASFGFRVYRLERGFVTAGLHYQRLFVGYGAATAVGGELGYMKRQGKTFVHATYALSMMTDASEWLGPRHHLDVRAFWRGLGPFAVYGHLGYAYGSAGDRSFHGPIVQLGLAWVWQ